MLKSLILDCFYFHYVVSTYIRDLGYQVMFQNNICAETVFTGCYLKYICRNIFPYIGKACLATAHLPDFLHRYTGNKKINPCIYNLSGL